MKKLKFIFGLIFLFLIFALEFGYSWSNSSYAYNSQDYNYNTDFGTHDWIALNSLDFLYTNNSKWKWLKDREKIFLVGTEAPDNANVQMILNGKVIDGFGDTTKHHIYLNEDGTIKNNEDDSALRSKWCRDLADACAEDGKLDQASFYLGAMTHYIADVSMFSHCAENYVAPHNLNFDEHHSQIEGYVNSRTNNYYDQEEFFNITICPCSLKSSKPTYNITINLAWNTYKDPDPSNATIRDAVWLHNYFFTNWDLTQQQRKAQTNQTKRLYYDRIEENLNNAIGTCIMGINSIGQPNILPSDDDNDDNDDDFDFVSINGYNLLILSGSLIGIITILIIKKKIQE